MNIEFVRATADDVAQLIEVQNLSFYADYVKYGECPGYRHSTESMTNIIQNKIVYKICCDGQTVGDIIVKDNGAGNYFLGCLCVVPDYENRGIGQVAMRFLETEFPNARVWTLETPADKCRNHYFYKKMGYQIIKEYMDGSVKIVLFEKRAKGIDKG